MSTDETSVNPYSPAIEVPQSEIPDSLETIADTHPMRRLARTATRWFTICGVSAVPSFIFGFSVSGGQITAMLLGILIFAIGYTLVDFRTANWPIRQKKMVRRMLKIVYGTRIVITIILPIAAWLDVLCGMLSFGLVQIVAGTVGSARPSGDEMTFGLTLITTLVQGCTLNVVLLIYGIVVYAVYLIVRWLKRERGNHS